VAKEKGGEGNGKGEKVRKDEKGEETWNRAADWLRPALQRLHSASVMHRIFKDVKSGCAIFNAGVVQYLGNNRLLGAATKNR